MNRCFRAEIVGNEPLNRNHNLLSLSPLESVHEALPGQFFMVEAGHGPYPLLKRAFSLFRAQKDGFQIMFRIRGEGTKILSGLGKGTVLDVIGPLGTSYPVFDFEYTPVVVAGGIGMASVFSLIQRFSGRAVVFYGARTAEDLLMAEDAKALSAEFHLCTDDGSSGEKGSVLNALSKYLEEKNNKGKIVVYSCGPHPMLEALSLLTASFSIETYVSLEAHMACGVGACLGCVVKTVDGYKRVCKEGPVFSSEAIDWKNPK